MTEIFANDFRRSDVLSVKLALLEQIYETYNELARGFHSACEMSCSVCCSQNVLCTTIETESLLRYAEHIGRPNLATEIREKTSAKRLRPTLTVNSLAEFCTKSGEIPETRQEVDHTACPLLENSSCPVYAARPFACRSMWSEETCRPQGEAVMNPILVSISSVFHQIIEDVDRGGLYGNLLDIISYLSSPTRREVYLSKGEAGLDALLLRTVPSPGLMVPPEHRPYVMKWLNQLWGKMAAGLPFREAMLKLREMAP